MKIDFSLHKTLNALGKFNISYLTMFIAFLSSYNFWFLSIYFFGDNFLKFHGLIIMLMTTFAITTTWFIICTITVPKDYLLVSFTLNDFDPSENVIENRNLVNTFVFAEVMISHSIFAYLSYICNWKLMTFLTVAFLFIGIKYFVTDIFLKIEYGKFLKKQKEATRIE